MIAGYCLPHPRKVGNLGNDPSLTRPKRIVLPSHSFPIKVGQARIELAISAFRLLRDCLASPLPDTVPRQRIELCLRGLKDHCAPLHLRGIVPVARIELAFCFFKREVPLPSRRNRNIILKGGAHRTRTCNPVSRTLVFETSYLASSECSENSSSYAACPPCIE
jgi:hypothetical protein